MDSDQDADDAAEDATEELRERWPSATAGVRVGPEGIVSFRRDLEEAADD